MPKHFLLPIVCVCLFVFAVALPCAAQSWYHDYKYEHIDVSWNWGNSDIPQPDFSRFPPKPTSLDSPSWERIVVASDLDLSGRDLRNARIYLLGGMLRNINFDGANLEGAVFDELLLINCSFRGANLKNAQIIPSRICDMTDAILGGTAVFLTEEQMQSTWNFKNKDFSNTTFMGCRFPDVEYDSSYNFTNTFIISSPYASLDYTGTFFYCCSSDGPLAGGMSALSNNIKFHDFSWNQLPKGGGIQYTAEQAFRTHEFRQKSLHGLTIEGVDFSGSDFSGFTLGIFENCNFEGANFTDALQLSPQSRDAPDGCRPKFGFKYCWNLTNEQLEQTRFWKSGNLTGMVFEFLDLDGWDFSNKDLSNVSFAYSSLRNAKFEDAIINHTNFRQISFISSPSSLTSSSPISLTAEQLQQTRAWQAKQFIGCAFQRINFDNLDLSGFDFSGTMFFDCSFKNTNLTGAIMSFPERGTVGRTKGLTENQLRSLKNFREDMLRFISE